MAGKPGLAANQVNQSSTNVPPSGKDISSGLEAGEVDDGAMNGFTT